MDEWVSGDASGVSVVGLGWAGRWSFGVPSRWSSGGILVTQIRWAWVSVVGESFGFEALGLVIGFTYIEMGSLGVIGVISSPRSCLAYCNFWLGVLSKKSINGYTLHFIYLGIRSKFKYKKIQIIYLIFCVPFYTPPIMVCHMFEFFFLPFLNFDSYDWWSIKWNIKSEIRDLYSYKIIYRYG